MSSLFRASGRCRRAWGGGLVVILLVALAGCAAPPVVRFHSLLPAEPAPPRPQPAAPPMPAPRLVVAPVRIPSALDQPQWLVRRADASLQLLEQDRWASPLADELRAALREALAVRHGVADGSLPLAPVGERPALPAASAWRLLVEVLRLEAWPGQYSQLEVQWALQPPRTGAQAAQCRFMVREPVAGPGSLALAEAHRRAVLRLADDIGRQLQGMVAGGSAACSGPPTS